ncbi:TIGR03620 family F420-dependent LLM class oxidoreductase [Frankia sp. CNm7]|uniref:TIGR03620 family F420-dependent LLM class oxidoreductase n=1 Tax=Frankia nepalensis TaxID=1836974 RepID=A0A937RIN7_9ACTN|nr:TIGR03620 family F420-dependent LLM class oxidoreductase [Frankia nepalensis]MBL7499754.1 TIGR03620 family F420-dependent LLM class oxidoreductase [Frankia nepalensis]MBL7512239.1 TIGR03620 family F420-dependent LLM class oxidoreductase [Frankia nepalensis]MBL7523950.1 TIGR03620 family F420-dependent LLM class oxidoreductase [Frankia nepalensis]MBL7632976.1 TIGR03620 family F420-dependent LLM class oxidoreductase [Frankia nepalensis]
MNLSGVGVWSQQLRYGDPAESAEAAAELEELGFGALWIPDMGGPMFGAVENLLAATSRVVVATGVLNLWNCAAAEAAASYASSSAAHGDRFLLGVGVSHAVAVDAGEPGRYRRPLTAMATFLDGLDTADPPVPVDRRVLAALGPRMLELAAKRARGVHPYLVTPEHTRRAREAVGRDALVLPEQAVILCATADEAHAIGGAWLRGYLSLPNYANSLVRLGYAPEEVRSVSDRVFDAMIAWGDEDAIMRRVREHHAAGADQVALQVLTADQRAFPREEWRRLAAALP